MKRTSMAVLLALVGFSAQAADDVPGWRAGAAASFTDFSWTDGDTDLIDDGAIGAKFWVQYQFGSWFGIEGAYHDTGTFKDTGGPSESGDPGDTFELSFDGFSVSGIVYLPFETEGVKFYGKAGYYSFDDELAFNGSVSSTGSESGLTAGAGATIAISDHFGIRADFDWFDAEVGDLWSANLGLEYSFGGSGSSESSASAPPPPPPPPAEPAPATDTPAGEQQ